MTIKTSTRWFWILLPSTAAIGGVGTLIPLYIVSPSVGGTVVEVGAAAAAFNLALIPAALLWGRAADALGRRRPILILFYFGMAGILGLMYQTQTLGQLILEYAIFAFLTAGPGPVVSLLLIETTPKQVWSKMFARLSSISTIGLMLGSLPGVFWTLYFDLKSYFLLCFLYGLAALVAANWWIPEPPITLERRAIVQSPESLALRLLTLPLIFLKVPTFTDFRRFWRMLRGITNELPLLYFFTLFFFMSGSMFFTSYTPFLVERGVTESQTFLAYFLLFFINTLTFIWAGKTVSRIGESRSGMLAVAVRAISMLGGAVIALGLKEATLLIATIIIFAVIGTTFSFANTAISTLLFRLLRTENQGELLGVYSALTAAGLFIGASLSGIFSFQYGFSVTFSVAAFFLVVSLGILRFFIKVALPTTLRSTPQV